MNKLLLSLTITSIAAATYLFLLLFISTTKHIKARTHFAVYLAGMLLWQIYLFSVILTKSAGRALALYNLLVGAAALANILRTWASFRSRLAINNSCTSRSQGRNNTRRPW